ncbi:hypothetical protein ACWV26_05810 [Rummeliibacillus sp. JY-2-4R]
MISKEIFVESITSELVKGLTLFENISDKQIRDLKVEVENREQLIEQLNEQIIDLKHSIKSLTKLNLNLISDRKRLKKQVDAKNKKVDFTEGITLLLSGNKTTEEKVVLIKYLLEKGIDDTQTESYIEELMQLIIDALTKFDFEQKKTIKRSLKKYEQFYHHLFVKAPPFFVRLMLQAYYANSMNDMLKNFLEVLVESELLYSYNDEDALNILIYQLFYKQIEEFQSNTKIKSFYTNQDKNYSKKLFIECEQYYVHQNNHHFREVVTILQNMKSEIDLLKVEMMQFVLKKIFKKEAVENYYSLDRKQQITTNKINKFRHPHYSELRNFGYQITDRTDEQRWSALQEYMTIYGLEATVNELTRRIRLKMGTIEDQERYANALNKWRFDLERLKETYFENDFYWPVL